MKDKIFNGQISGRKEIHAEGKMRFDCHTGVACFTRCCKDADMYLYPYDIIRMKNRLGISSDRFLKHYVIQAIRDNPYFPSLMLKMSDDEEKSCPFLSPEGCTIYKDRPFSCRAYPLLSQATRMATTVPVIQVDRVPATMERKPNETIASRLSGAIVPMPPIIIPRLPGLAKPHMA